MTEPAAPRTTAEVYFAPIDTVIAAIIASRIKLEEDVVLISSPLHLFSSTANGKDGVRTVCVRVHIHMIFERQATANIQNSVFFSASGLDLWLDLIWIKQLSHK